VSDFTYLRVIHYC